MNITYAYFEFLFSYGIYNFIICLYIADTSKRISTCKKRTKDIVKPLIQQINLEKDNGFSFSADDSLKIKGNPIFIIYWERVHKTLIIYPIKQLSKTLIICF